MDLLGLLIGAGFSALMLLGLVAKTAADELRKEHGLPHLEEN